MPTFNLRFKTIVIFFVFIFISNPKGISQPKAKTDSIKQAIRNSNQDTVKIKLLTDLGDLFKNDAPDSALHYYEQAYALAKDIEAGMPLAKCTNTLGVYYFSQSNYKKAEEYYQQALELFENLKDKKGISDSYNNIGIINAVLGNYNRSLENFLHALDQIADTQMEKGKSKLYNNIGLLYRDLQNFDKALEFFNKGLLFSQKLNDIRGIAAAYNNIGLVYYSQGNYYHAAESYKKGLEITKANDKRGKSILITNLGIVNNDQGNYKLALSYFQQGLKLDTELGNKHGVGAVYGYIAELYTNLKIYNKAIVYARKQLDLAKDLGVLPQQQFSYSLLCKAYDSLKDYKSALKYHKLFKQVNDSIFSEKKSQQIAEMQARFETSEKERENELLRKDNELNNLRIDKQTGLRNFFIALSAFILMLFIVIYFRLKAKKEANLLLKGKNTLIDKQKKQLSQNLADVNRLNEELNIHKSKLEDKVKERTQELETKNEELERYNSLFVGREFRIKELRDQIKELKEKYIDKKEE